MTVFSKLMRNSSSQLIASRSSVVGRLVEEQDIRIAEKRLREQYLDLQRARQIRHHRVVFLGRDAEPV